VATEEREAERGSRHVPPGEGSISLWVFGELVTYKVTSAQTGGAYSLFEVATHPGGGPPPHVQHREDEYIYVLEGEYEFLDEYGSRRARAGSLLYIPRGNLHSYNNVGNRHGRVLVCQSPGGLHESFFEEIGEQATNRSRSPAPGVLPDSGRIAEVAAKFGIEIPPPCEGHTGESGRRREEAPE
jgi:quercetin dioxygenase-like cupin family protein